MTDELFCEDALERDESDKSDLIDGSRDVCFRISGYFGGQCFFGQGVACVYVSALSVTD